MERGRRGTAEAQRPQIVLGQHHLAGVAADSIFRRRKPGDPPALEQRLERARRLRLDDEARHGVVGEVGQFEVFDDLSHLTQRGERRLEIPGNPGLGLVERPLEDAEFPAAATRRRLPCRRHRGGIVGIGPGDGRQHESAIFRRPRERSELVHRPAERHGAVAAHPAVGGAQAAHSTEARRETGSIPTSPSRWRRARVPRRPTRPIRSTIPLTSTTGPTASFPDQ